VRPVFDDTQRPTSAFDPSVPQKAKPYTAVIIKLTVTRLTRRWSETEMKFIQEAWFLTYFTKNGQTKAVTLS